MATSRKGKKPAAKPRARRKAEVQLPEPRGRRGHKSVDDQPGLREWLVERLQEKPRPTYEQLRMDALATGFAIGRTAIWEFHVDLEIQLAQRDLYLKIAEAYGNADGKGGQVLRLETAISTLLNSQMLRHLHERSQQLTPFFDDETIELFKIHSRHQASASAREKTKSVVDRKLRRLEALILRNVAERLGNDSKAMGRVVSAVKASVAEAAE